MTSCGSGGGTVTRRRMLAGTGALVTGALAGTVLGACADNTAEETADRAGSTSTAAPPSTESPTTAPPDATDPDATDPTTTDPDATGDAYVPPPDPEAWETRDPAELGWSAAAIDELVTYVGDHRSTTLVLVSGGYLIAEQYWGDATATTTQDIASCQKSVVSTLVGVARTRGLLALDDPVTDHLGPGWTNADPADESAITIRHLLSMTSGLDQETLEAVDPPGTRWRYNTTAYQKLRPVLEAAAGDDIESVTRAWLWDPIGVSEVSRWAPRAPTNVDATGARLWGLDLTARDMARFGLLVQRRGTWGTTPVVEAAWFDEALAPSQEMNPAYGYLWWLAGDRPAVPPDFVAALGALDQKIYVCPSLDLVLARQGGPAGAATENTSDFDTELLTRLLAARV